METIIIRELDEGLFYIFTISTMYILLAMFKTMDTELNRTRETSVGVDVQTQTEDILSQSIMECPELEDIENMTEEEDSLDEIVVPIIVQKKRFLGIW